MAITKKRHQDFVRLRTQIKSAEDVIGKLHTADATLADKEISDLKLSVVNRLLKDSHEFLATASPLTNTITLPLTSLPTHGDVLLLVGQLLAAFDGEKAQHVQFRHDRWYWLVQKEGSTEIEYVLVDPAGKAESAD